MFRLDFKKLFQSHNYTWFCLYVSIRLHKEHNYEIIHDGMYCVKNIIQERAEVILSMVFI